ncbi:uncharacterized protein LOC142172099 [Nicotiana tabacum]|uniref:Uncharacterized protein LOC142172099 n=1 Tax=Nicotiana tabacum TaxID=4097 RepID=A0AC58T481_TOBAC
MVTSWILNSLSKDLADSLQYVKDAEELWQELEDRYDQTNGAKLYQLQKEINDLTQGSLDITGYYTKMKKLWEELNILNINARCTCNCTCGAKASMHKAKQDRRLIQFLMGLNEAYTIVRGSILMINPLPSLAQAFPILIQEEKQREMRPQSQLLMESTALNAGGDGNNNFRNTNGNGYNNFKTNYNQQTNNNTGNNAFRGNYSQNRSRLYCDFCKRPGHTKDKCYKLHGTRDQGRAVHNFTSEQYGQLLSILENFQANSNNNIGDHFGNANIASGAVNFTGIVACSSSTELAPSLKRPLEIGKSNSGLYLFSDMCNNKSNTHVSPAATVTHTPSTSGHSNSLTIIPNNIFTVSLDSSSKACDSSVNVGDSRHLCNYVNALNTNNNNDGCSICSTSLHQKDTVDLLWYNRLGHVPFVKMRGMPSIPTTFAPRQPFLCHICPMARQTRLPFPEKTNSTTKIFELLHVDLWGPYHITTHNKYIYFITLVDDYSRSTWTHLLSCKSNALHILKGFIAMIETQFNTTVKAIRTDNGLEFTESEITSYLQTKENTPYNNVNVDTSITNHTLMDTQSPNTLYSSTDQGIDLSPSHISDDTRNLSSNDNQQLSLNPIIRRPSRTHKIPAYLKDYVVALPKSQSNYTVFPPNSTSTDSTPSFSFIISSPTAQHISLYTLIHDSQQLVTNISYDCEPGSYEEASLDPAWQATMTQEFEALYANHTWDLVPLTAGKRAIGCK